MESPGRWQEFAPVWAAPCTVSSRLSRPRRERLGLLERTAFAEEKNVEGPLFLLPGQKSPTPAQVWFYFPFSLWLGLRTEEFHEGSWAQALGSFPPAPGLLLSLTTYCKVLGFPRGSDPSVSLIHYLANVTGGPEREGGESESRVYLVTWLKLRPAGGVGRFKPGDPGATSGARC